jgi:hypothetical protein
MEDKRGIKREPMSSTQQRQDSATGAVSVSTITRISLRDLLTPPPLTDV